MGQRGPAPGPYIKQLQDFAKNAEIGARIIINNPAWHKARDRPTQYASRDCATRVGKGILSVFMHHDGKSVIVIKRKEP